MVYYRACVYGAVPCKHIADTSLTL